MKTKYFIVTENGRTQYIKLESEWSFSKEEGIATIKESRPNAEVEYIAKAKAEKMLQLHKS